MDAEKATESMTDNIVIPAHTLFAEYPPKIAEAEINPSRNRGEIVLPCGDPGICDCMTAPPSDPTARDYYVHIGITSKTLPPARSIRPYRTRRSGRMFCHHVVYVNRVYTEWYRNKGCSLLRSRLLRHMTRNSCMGATFTRASRMWWMRCSRTISPDRNVRQPILTQYCDGSAATGGNWLSQWGSKYLGDQNYETIEILRYYYGNNMFINTAEEVSGHPGVLY